jgi:dTDP-glucose pyrophosphorylase
MHQNKWQSCILGPEETIRTAIDNLVKSSTKIVLVVSEQGEFLGTISDGDIRRGILRGVDLDEKISEIIHREAITASPGTPRQNIKKLMLVNKIQQIPILDDNGVLQGLYEWDSLESTPEKDNLFVVMAGGEGRRLMPHTLNTPKPMVQIHGKPMLEHILLKAKSNGFHNFIFVVHHLSQIIEEYFENGSKWDVNIQYVKEDKPLGTAGGLAQLIEIGNQPLVITNSDVISDLSYSDILQFHLDNQAQATMAVRQHEIVHPFGVVSLEGLRITTIEEKPTQRSYINAGVYVLSAGVIRSLARGVFMNMTDFFATLIERKENVCAYPIHESWIDVGRPEDLNNIVTKFREN